MILLVTGGRNYKDERLVRRVLKTMDPQIVLFGDAAGADEFAEKWVHENDVRHKRFDADWDRYDKGAGPVRNREMIDYALGFEPWPIVVAFPGGKGTANCVSQAKDMRLIVLRVEEAV